MCSALPRGRTPDVGWWRRRPLSTQLVVIVVALGAAALLVAGSVAVAALRNYLIGQIDQQLLQVTRSGFDDDNMPGPPLFRGPGSQPAVFRPADAQPVHPVDDEPELPGDGHRQLPAEFFVAWQMQSGTVQILSRPFSAGSPDLTSLVTVPPGQPVTVPGEGGAWRAIGQPVRQGTLFVAKPLAEVEATVSRLILLEGVVGLVVLGALALTAFYAVRRSLRPLATVEQTATAIAAGDLSRRVPEHEPTTEVGQLSAAFNSMVDEIEQTIGERDDALQESRQSEARMRQFVADASHELRTPLTTIRGYSELYLRGGVPPERVPETFDRLEGEAKRMGGLVDDLLLLARLDQQRPLEQHPVDLLHIANEVVQATRAAQPVRALRLRTEGSAAPVVIGDEMRLRQVLGNLVGNACKYSDGEVVVTVDSSRAGWVRAAVADSGPGIPDAEKSRVFERFYRGDPSRTRSAGGSGLGLSIVAAIVSALGGSVSVRDNSPTGAIFDVWLPAQPD